MAKISEKAKAKEQMVNSVRDLHKAKIKIPLGNPNLKLVHTNQMLFTELSEEVFELANFGAIASALNSSYSRYSGYVFNRWYIENNTITNNGKEAHMELELNPFPSNILKFRDERDSFDKAYTDATKTNTTSKTSNTGKTSKTVKSVNTGLKLKNVKGFSKSDQAYIKKVVTKALKARGNPTKPLIVAYAIYEHYNKNHVYDNYDCMPKMRAGGFEKTWKNKHHNCGDGAATIVAMMRCANLKADIMHKKGHFYVRVNINGTYYYCDQAGAIGKRNSRTLGKKGNNNNVYGGITSSASVVGFKYC